MDAARQLSYNNNSIRGVFMNQTATRPTVAAVSESSPAHIRAVLAGFMVVFFGFGCYYGFPVYYPSLIQSFGWSRSQIAGGASLALLVSGLLSPVVGILADRWGPRLILLCGTLVAGLAMVGLSRMHSLTLAYGAFCVFGVGMSGFSLMVTQMLMAQWFVRSRGLATGLVIAGMGLGGAVAPLLVAPILARSGWRMGFLLQGAALVMIGCPAILCLIRPSRKPTPVGANDVNPSMVVSRSTAGLSYRQALATRHFWLLAAASFFAMFAAAIALQHTVLYMRESHVSLTQASRTLSLLLLASVAGRLLLGWMSDLLTRRRTLLLAYLFLTGGMAMLTLAPSPRRLFVMALLVGIGYGGTVVMMTLTSAEIFGLRALGQILGSIVFCFTVGGAVGPVLVGRLVDHGISYRSAFTVAAISAACAVLCAAALQGAKQTKEAR